MPLEEKQSFASYLERIKERAKKSRIYSRHQMIGLMVADILEDSPHKALYMKIARAGNGEKMLYIAKSVAENSKVKNKGAYFMRLWQLEKRAEQSGAKKKLSSSVKKNGARNDKKRKSKNTEA